jgi:hypothetical protein
MIRNIKHFLLYLAICVFSFKKYLIRVSEGGKMVEKYKLSPLDPMNKSLDNKEENAHRRARKRKNTENHKS